MRRRRDYYEDEDVDLGQLIGVIVVSCIFYLVIQYYTNRANFWRLLIYGTIVTVVLVGSLWGWQETQRKKQRRYFYGLLKQIREKGLEDYIKNFINRFGFEGKKGKDFTVRNYAIPWERIRDLEQILREKGIELRNNEKQRDILSILRYYIEEKEKSLTRESIKKEPQKFAALTGSDFEKLLYRLFEAMGYKVQLIGRPGDQGGDLIANKNGERILIQAKAYRDWPTGNAAVQQAVAAMKYYDCNKAMVITTSYFTKEAIALAKANNVELISKKRLQELLLNYLGESWS